MGTLTTDKEETLLRGYIPLAKDILKTLNSGEQLEEIFFPGNGYVNDAVLQIIKRKCKSKNVFSDLREIQIPGCDLITDYGIRCLLDVIDVATNLKTLNLDGCRNLTDNSYALLAQHLGSNINVCKMKATSVAYLTGNEGCPNLHSAEDFKHGQVLIVPHSSMTKSLGKYICIQDGSPSDIGHGLHENGVAMGEWTMSVNEVASSSPMLDLFTNSLLTQVIIPFEAGANPADVKDHIMSTMAKVVAKEPVVSKFPQTSKLEVTITRPTRPFMDILMLDKFAMYKEGGHTKVRNISLIEKSIGCYISQQPLTRSNCYFEVTIESLKKEDEKVAILLGCLHDLLYTERHPMDSSVDKGGYVDAFEFDAKTKTIGFGISGDWISEYIPGPDATYYFNDNGQVVESKIETSKKEKPQNGMYPLVSVLGEMIGKVTLPELVSPPKELAEKWQKEQRWVEKGFSYNCMVDNYGNLRYVPNYETPGPGYFLGMHEFKNENPSFSVEITGLAVNQGFSSEFKVGLAGEIYTHTKIKESGVVEFTVNLSPYFSGWTCPKCNFQNEGNSTSCVSCTDGERPKEAVNPKEWLCGECKFPNEVHVDTCSSCKKGKKPSGFGEMRQEIFSQINGQLDTKVVLPISTIKEGDILTVSMSDISDEQDKVNKITFYVNNKEITFRNFVFKPTKPCRMVPYVEMTSKYDCLRLKNYRPTYRQPAPYKDKVTVGRATNLGVYDDGRVVDRPGVPMPRDYHIFVAKTPFNREQTEFTVELTKLGNRKLFGIGVTAGFDLPNKSFLGWKQGTVGYHADNGQLYDNASSGVHSNVIHSNVKDESVISSGDVIKVMVTPKDEKTPIKYDANGYVDSQQTVNLVFMKNDLLIHQVDHEILGPSLYPAFSLKDSEVKIRNFYPESKEIWDQVDKQTVQFEQEEKDKKSKQSDLEDKPYCGTEFLVVGVASGASDVSGKLQILQQQIDLNEWEEMKTVSNTIKEMEKNLGDMTLQDQVTYGELCAIEDNMMELLVKNRTRISYHHVDLNDSGMRSPLIEKIENIQTRHMALQHSRYQLSSTMRGIQAEILQKLANTKVISFKELQDIAVTESDSKLKDDSLDGVTLLALLKDLQNRGKVLLLDMGEDCVLLDIKFFMNVEERLNQLNPAEMVDVKTMVKCIGQSSHIWSKDTLTSKILVESIKPEKLNVVRSVLEHTFGLICVRCLRTTPSDEEFIFVTQQNVSNPTVSMGQYWSTQMDNKDFVVLQQTYTFPLHRPGNLISLLISNTTKYGRIVILTGEGVVYQNGAVQTVIVCSKDVAGKNVIVMESRCYMPSVVATEECGMTKQTVSYVRDYTWNIFCIYKDIVEDYLRRSQITFTGTSDWSEEMVNVSIGCKHCYISPKSGVKQTICTLCNQCCDKGDNCDWNGIMGDYLRHCGCETDISGCGDCGICKRCAETLWGIRSRLRPYSTVMMKVNQTVAEKLRWKSGENKDNASEALLVRDPVRQPSLPLDPFCYNEVEFTNLSSLAKAICLKEESDGSLVQAYPGSAKKIESVTDTTLIEKVTSKYSMSVGDQIKLKLSDPMDASSHAVTEEEAEEEDMIIENIYFSLQAREVKIMQETGIVMYDTLSTGTIPVGQFIGCKPMTKENNTFSVRILCSGEKNTIAIGLVPANYPPNRQPGWNAQSIGYHADDGGVFLESGSPTRRTKIANKGDIMTLYIDFDKNKGWFRKNGEKCIELNLNPSRLGYYPCIGFHSVGEAVQIIEKDIWTPVREEDRNRTQPSTLTFKYGNLWISPGKKITMVKFGSHYHAWIILHNPRKDPVGFKVRCGPREEDAHFGVITHKKEWIKDFKKPVTAIPAEVTVEWTSLESGREYTTEEMKAIFGTGVEQVHQSAHQHRLPVKLRESATVLEELSKVSQGLPKEKSLCLQVYRNLKLVDKYWIKYGNYQVLVECNTKTDNNFILKYPKCPGFNYGKTFTNGMKLIFFLESEKVYAECIVVDIYGGGNMMALEYSPKDKNTNTTICAMANSPALNFTEFDENTATVWPYETRNTPTNLTRTFFIAPSYLLAEGPKKVLNFINKEWKANTLKTFSYCYQVFTRLTVQERHICSASRKPLEWVKNGTSNYLYSFLPSQLSDTSLVYPNGSSMFSDIAVHRMCFSADELLTQIGLDEEDVAWRIPLHFVDIPGIIPQQSLPPEATFGDGLIVWTYVSLISSRLHLPSYTKMITGDTSSMTRAQIEQLLFNLLQIYSALCSIYSATWGGVEYSNVNEERSIKMAIKYNDNHITKFSGKPQTQTDMLYKKSKFATCKAHSMAMDGSDEMFPNGVEFDYEYFEPYTDLVSMFQWTHSKLTGLPEDFFEKFRYLQYLRLGVQNRTMAKFEKLPEGIAKCKSLKVVELTQTAMKELPEDFFMSPSLVSIYCTNMPIEKLPKQWPQSSQVSELVLAGLLLKEIPAELSSLRELERLELCYNPITNLPQSLSTLTKLKILYLSGPLWLTLEGKKSQMTREQYDAWHMLNPYVKNYFGREKVEELFKEFDFNNNGSLDEEELAALNLKLFLSMPRIGLADVNDEVTGGIPEVVFSLKSLCELYLDYCAVTMVPQSINNLQNLNTLSLNHNPLLLSLPGSLGHLPNIKGINIHSCPSIRTPPTEVVSRGFESVKAYLKRLAGGFTECRRTKLMVVGLGGAGKTSLLRALMSEKKMTAGTEDEIPTDGIDIVPWTVASEDGREVTYSTWDFAGQAVYYNTHQFFLSKRAVYLLLWSMRQGYEHAGLDFWLSSICCHAPGTPILVVGTQCDLIPQAEIPEKELRERYPQIASFHQVSSIKGIGIENLQKSLLDVTLQQGYMGEKIPQVWLNFEKRIIAERRTKKNYIKWEVARQYAMEQGIYDEKDVRLAIQLLHDLGTVQYFDNDFLRDYVVINPQWIVNVMACVVSAQDSPIQVNKGRFLHKDISTVWKDYTENLHPWLLRLTEDFDLTFPLPKEAINIVPCLLPGEAPEDLVWPKVRGQQGIRETKMVYRFTYLPSGLFNRAQVRLFQFSDGKMIWKKGSLLSKNNHLALIKQTDSKELVVFVQGPRPENIVFMIHEVFESIIEESFNGVHYELFLPCPDCIVKEGTSEPDLLNARLIQRAKDLKAPFLQCYKYFHWVSMSQLQEKLPADSREVSDFDMQLQQSIVALQELNNDLLVDVAIIYSSKDVPSPGDTTSLPPALLRDDATSWGYTCWFADDMDTVSYVDLTAAIKNCKVLIALVSDNFESDTKCSDMFLYAKDTMNKDVIIVVVGESMEWQARDLGVKIGRQERMLMVKTLPRYTVEGGRREELKTWLEEKMATQSKVEPNNLDVFVSYAWSNSKEAQGRSGKNYESGLGWGDPRQLKSALENEGISCWLDIEQVGREKQGIFADMAAGIRNSKVILACISDEYAESDNCMMELRFAILNMNLPLVVAVVGSGSAWKETEVAMLLRRARAPEVFMQQENKAGVKTMIKFVKDAIVDSALAKKKKAADQKSAAKTGEKSKKDKEKASSVAYKEEYELVQRKFMRHILGSISFVDAIPMPRLMVVDFVKSVASKSKDNDGRDSKAGSSSGSFSSFSFSKKKLRPKSATKSRDRLQIDSSVFEDDDETNWSKESFCIKLLCENEEGWHLCDQMYPLAFRSRDHLETFLKKAAPYLYRIYSLLSQSPIKLKCFVPGMGKAFQDWIKLESDNNIDFVGALQHLRAELVKDEATEFMSCLARCRLPSGKIIWLCENHQSQQHVAKLSTSSTGGSYSLQRVLYNEDKLLLENLDKSDDYKKMKNKKSTKVATNIPEPVPIPMFTPNVRSNTVDEIPEKKDDDKDESKEKEKQSQSELRRQNSAYRPSKTESRRERSTSRERPSKTESRRERSRSRERPSKTESRRERSRSRERPSKTESRRERSRSREKKPKAELRRMLSIQSMISQSSSTSSPKTPDIKSPRNAESQRRSPALSSSRADTHSEKPKDKAPKLPQTNTDKPNEERNENDISEQSLDDPPEIKAHTKQKETKTSHQSSHPQLSIDSRHKKSSFSSLNNLIKGNKKVSMPRSTYDYTRKFGQSDQQEQKPPGFGGLQRGSNVRRVSTNNLFAEKTSKPGNFHRRVSETTSNQLKMSLKINSVKDKESMTSSQTGSLTDSAKSGVSLASGSRDKAPSTRTSLEKVHPRKIKVVPKAENNAGQQKDAEKSFKATGIGIGKSPDMALPSQDGSKACILQ